MEKSFSIHSAHSSHELVLTCLHGECLVIEVKAPDHQATSIVWVPAADTNSLARFFQELGALSVPWPDVRTWSSVEQDFCLHVTCSPLGGVVFKIELHNTQRETEKWSVMTNIASELGQLGQIAKTAMAALRT